MEMDVIRVGIRRTKRKKITPIGFAFVQVEFPAYHQPNPNYIMFDFAPFTLFLPTLNNHYFIPILEIYKFELILFLSILL